MQRWQAWGLRNITLICPSKRAHTVARILAGDVRLEEGWQMYQSETEDLQEQQLVTLDGTPHTTVPAGAIALGKGTMRVVTEAGADVAQLLSDAAPEPNTAAHLAKLFEHGISLNFSKVLEGQGRWPAVDELPLHPFEKDAVWVDYQHQPRTIDDAAPARTATAKKEVQRGYAISKSDEHAKNHDVRAAAVMDVSQHRSTQGDGRRVSKGKIPVPCQPAQRTEEPVHRWIGQGDARGHRVRGAYNTPQLLKLSGIGPKEELQQFKIPVIKDSQGVGKNLQDRYEIPVNVKHTKDFNILNGCTFDSKPHDRCLKKWQNNPYVLGLRGAYATNGLAAAMVKRSNYASDSNTDLFIFGGPVNFDGYYPGWSQHAIADHRHFPGTTLKAHTRNHAGTVELRSADPFDPPSVNFNYFDTGTTEKGADQLDLQAIVQAIKTSRSALAKYSHYGLLGGPPFTEEAPGPAVQTDAELQDYVKDRAWGHHASCTAPIGSNSDPNAVLDGQFRVRGVDGLRVVDASVFPQIPGVFIQAPIYIISEKAADVILSAAKLKQIVALLLFFFNYRVHPPGETGPNLYTSCPCRVDSCFLTHE
ncbi:hypothetical protein L7F22_010050 [Adiantum nelumboides]|nr:hypothetical protein [Adiantum nelumboides]